MIFSRPHSRSREARTRGSEAILCCSRVTRSNTQGSLRGPPVLRMADARVDERPEAPVDFPAAAKEVVAQIRKRGVGWQSCLWRPAPRPLPELSHSLAGYRALLQLLTACKRRSLWPLDSSSLPC